jgi:diadenosine tetraphosphate (Ap4A) HIT family hydrolase
MSEGFCEFCQIYQQKKQQSSEASMIIAENEEFFAIKDLDNGSAVAHILLCTKEHIESALAVKEPQQLLRMQSYLE